MSNKISEIFDVTPVAPVIEAAPPAEIVPSKITDDADYARANLRDLIEKSRTALENALSVAVSSESPRAFEVVANMINTSADLNTKLMDVHQREQKIATDKKAPSPAELPAPGSVNNITNNVIFSGTTAELNELITKRIMNNETRSN